MRWSHVRWPRRWGKTKCGDSSTAFSAWCAENFAQNDRQVGGARDGVGAIAVHPSRIEANARPPEILLQPGYTQPAARPGPHFLGWISGARPLYDAGAHLPHARARRPLRVRLGDGTHRALARDRPRLRKSVQRLERPHRMDAAALS